MAFTALLPTDQRASGKEVGRTGQYQLQIQSWRSKRKVLALERTSEDVYKTRVYSH